MLASIALLAVIVRLGSRRYDSVTRMVSTSSRAISAACLVEDREDRYLLPMQWGVVSVSKGLGKRAFAIAPLQSEEQDKEGIRMPKEGMKYI